MEAFIAAINFRMGASVKSGRDDPRSPTAYSNLLVAIAGYSNQVVASIPVRAHRPPYRSGGARVRVAGGDLHVTQAHAGAEHGGPERCRKKFPRRCRIGAEWFVAGVRGRPTRGTPSHRR